MNISKIWTLKNHKPYPEQTEIIKEIITAIDQGYKNIILEAGTGTGKSAIATTISNHIQGDSYIVTMTNQLLQQYLDDFDDIVKEIKGRSNYPCNHGGTCEECSIDDMNRQRWEEYLKALKQYKSNPDKYLQPEKPKRVKKCGKDEKDPTSCPYLVALTQALQSPNCITNYDFLHYAGNYGGILPERELIIFDESHNFESKNMQLVIRTFNRKVIWQKYNIDIFDAIVQDKIRLKDLKNYNYWINICEQIISIIRDILDKYLFESYGDTSNYDNLEFEILLEQDDTAKSYKNEIKKYDKIIEILREEKWVIETPTKKEILNDDTYLTKNKEKGLTVTLKPLTIHEYTETLLHFGEIRLFMTGTLGNKELFCKWNGLNPDETYYLYHKSPFNVDTRPIVRAYLGHESEFNMSGRTNGEPNWKNETVMITLHDILEDHPHEKGVIHTSSKDQAWWIRNELKSYLRRPLRVASGKRREEVISEFEDNDDNMVLISPSVKDGVDFKGDKCRFQIIFKCPFPMLKGEQINRRKRNDPEWYIYQTVMPLMQAYGRGIRDHNDYCTTYILDSSMEGLITNHINLFNEYFLEAIQDFDMYTARKNYERKNKSNRKIRVKRVPRVEAK